MRIEEDSKLDFSNVLIRPKRSRLGSRSEVSLERTFTFPNSKETWTGVPIISANMDTTGTFETHAVLRKYKMLTALHKHYTIEDFKNNLDILIDDEYHMISTGISDKDFDKLCKIMEITNSKWICIDIANGYMERFVKFCKKVRVMFPKKIIVGGNVVSNEMVEELIINGGVDVVKCGIGGGCFAKETRVLMANGIYKNINEINEGEYVINSNGEPVKVLNVMNKGFRNVISIRTNNFHDKTIVTPEHKYWIGDLSSSSRKSLTSSGKVKLLEQNTKNKQSKYKWYEIGHLDKIENKCCLLMPNNIKWKLSENITIDLASYCKLGKITTNFITTKNQHGEKKINRYLKSNYNLGYIFGTFLGDGYTQTDPENFSSSSHWSFDKKEIHIVNKLVKCIKNELGYECTYNVKQNKVLAVHCYNKIFTSILQKFSKRINKHLPQEYYCTNKQYIQGLFDGLIDSDGYTEITPNKKHIYMLSNTSKKILELFYWCCMNLNISYSSVKCKKSIGNLTGTCIDNLKDSYRIKTHTLNRFTKNYVYNEIFEKTNINKKTEVYDIEVDCDTHSFIANNSIVHNSVCLTRLKTGVGMPQLSAVIECADAAHGVQGHIISDGGITCPGDMAKAFGGGADFVMCGSVFAGHTESGGDLVEVDGIKMKLFYGMSSEHAMDKHYGGKAKYRSSEGRVIKIKYKGDIDMTVEDYLGGLRSCCTYINAKSIKEIPKCTTFVKVTQQLNTSLVK